MQPQPAPTPLPLMAGPQAQLSWKSWKPWAGVALLAWAGLLQVCSTALPPPPRRSPLLPPAHLCSPCAHLAASCQRAPWFTGSSPLSPPSPSPAQWDMYRLKRDPRFKEKFPEHAVEEEEQQQQQRESESTLTVRLKSGEQ